MLRLGTVDLDMLAYLWFVVEHGSNMIVVGATATGKTSFLNSLAFFMPQESKVVSIEDTRELRIEHENWIPAVARLGFSGTKVGEVSMFDLLKEAFRQNPNYLIVGEVRGEEAAVMFQAMASGITSMSTMHAGSVEDALKRLQTRPISLPPTLMETLDVMVIMARAVEKGASARRVRHIIEIESVDPATNQVKYTEAFAWDPAKDVYHKKKESIVFRKIAQEKGLTVAGIEKDILQRRQFLKWLASQDLDWKQVAEYLVLYKRNRTKALEAMKG
jgi:flagellar protein FlaI